MVIAGKTVVVCGYGWCGRGLALRAAGLGADVIVTEVDPIRALEARMDGYRVMTVKKALEEADIVVTNPPFRTIKGMPSEQKAYLQENYPMSKCDMCNAFNHIRSFSFDGI